jgi:predicted metal-dependent phosphoesterase TrpH
VSPAFDLHCHSTASDGELTPTALVAYAAERGLETLALTDHDTIDGVEEARAAGERIGLEIITGLELAARYPGGQCHLVVWLPDPGTNAIVEYVATLGDARRERARAMVKRLGDLGYPLDWDDVERRANGRIGRPHLADALVAAGYAADQADAFERLIGQDSPAYVAQGKMEPADAVALARASGGITSLAHPRTLRLDPADLDGFVAMLAAAGLDAIEAHRPDQPADEQAALVALADRHGLAVSAGSDFHGPAREHERPLGRHGTPGIDPDRAEALLSRLRGVRSDPVL